MVYYNQKWDDVRKTLLKYRFYPLWWYFALPVKWKKATTRFVKRWNPGIQPKLSARMITQNHCLGNIPHYYMASYASGQDEPNDEMWLATREGKTEPSCPLGTTRCISQEEFPRKPLKSFIDQVCSVKMAGYWPRSFFCKCTDIYTQKQNLANTQPSWPQTWSITHINRPPPPPQKKKKKEKTYPQASKQVYRGNGLTSFMQK